MQTQRLRIAIQKKGRLSKECMALLKQCGLKFNVMGERLVVHSLNMPIDLLLVRDDDIPGLIMDGVVDLGFVGENVLEEERLDRVALAEPSDFSTLRRMDFGGCRLSIAIDKDDEYNGPQDLNGKRIATRPTLQVVGADRDLGTANEIDVAVIEVVGIEIVDRMLLSARSHVNVHVPVIERHEHARHHMRHHVLADWRIKCVGLRRRSVRGGRVFICPKSSRITVM